MTENEIRALGSDLANRFNAELADDDDDVRAGSFLWAHDSTASASRQLRRIETLLPPAGVIVEIGTGKGTGTLALSRLADWVLTIDIGPYSLRRRIWEWGDADNICAIVVDGEDSKEMLLDQIEFDIAFIDGDHSAKGAWLDFRSAMVCRRCLFHDYTPPYENGPLKIAGQLPDEAVLLDPPFFWWCPDPVEMDMLRGVK